MVDNHLHGAAPTPAEQLVNSRTRPVWRGVKPRHTGPYAVPLHAVTRGMRSCSAAPRVTFPELDPGATAHECIPEFRGACRGEGPESSRCAPVRPIDFDCL